MDFARRILKNYGWKDGDGLGKNKDGIAKPLRATLKFDKAGFGSDQAAAEFNNHWWERVFVEAAANVSITKVGDQIKMALKDENSIEISTKSYSTKKLEKLKEKRGESRDKTGYGNFLRVATLTNLGDEVENPDKIDANDIEVSKIKVLTDDELFKACGGRTAHKGARHGLKLSGKLSRIERQESELLAEIMAKRVRKGMESMNKLRTKSVKLECIQDQSAEQSKRKKDKAGEETHKIREVFYAESSKRKSRKRKHCKIESATNRQEISVIQSKKKQPSIKKTDMVENKYVDTLNKDISGKDNDKTNSPKTKKNSENVVDIEKEIVHKRKKKNKHKDTF